MAQWSHQPLVVKPRDPFQGRQLHGFARFSRAPTMDQFGRVKSVDGLGKGVVVAIALAADRWRDAGFGEPLAVAGGKAVAEKQLVQSVTAFKKRIPAWSLLRIAR